MKSSGEHKRCLISDSADLRPLRGYEKHYLVRSYPAGFVFCSRVPSEEELISYYSQYPKEPFLSPITKKRYNELLNSFEKYRQTGNMLDIGCGNGYFLTEATNKGWHVYGTEFTDQMVNQCSQKGIIMKKGRLDATWYQEEMFDVVVSMEVLEHINNPVEEVRNICEILRKGGLFYFTTPNFNAVERFILKEKYTNIAYPEHLCYYTKKTVDYLLTMNGFRKKKIETTGFSWSHVRAGRKPGSEPLNSAVSSDEAIRTTIENNPVLNTGKAFTNQILSLLGIGNTLKGWYEKI